MEGGEADVEGVVHQLLAQVVVQVLRQAELADGEAYGVLLAVAQLAHEGEGAHVGLDDIGAGAHLVEAQQAGHKSEGRGAVQYAVGHQGVAQGVAAGAVGQVEAAGVAVGGDLAQSEGAGKTARQHGEDDE